MSISNTVKGLGSIKTMYNTKKSAVSNNEGSDFLKMYMLEKERTRLRSEEVLISRRLNIIQIRLNEIQEFYNGQSILLQNPGSTESYQTKKEEVKTNFKTMSIDY
jgi:hypothetical protein